MCGSARRQCCLHHHKPNTPISDVIDSPYIFVMTRSDFAETIDVWLEHNISDDLLNLPTFYNLTAVMDVAF